MQRGKQECPYGLIMYGVQDKRLGGRPQLATYLDCTSQVAHGPQ
jgi:hypothetical protein